MPYQSKISPKLSYESSLTGSQKMALLLLLVWTVWQAWYAPKVLVIGLWAVSAVVYSSLIWGRFHLFSIGKKKYMLTKEVDYALVDDLLPSYSIIVPLYKEARSLPQIITNISKILYPHNLLSVYIVLEEDDLETNEAIKSMTLPEHFVVLQVPSSYPRTKPKACNYALQFIRSELLVIYDAEDAPDPMQLRKVAQEFSKNNDSLACIQCQLFLYNSDENMLCTMFALEYQILFEYLLPAMDSLDLPIPLGGTSNHLKVDKLRQLGGWDSYNVTEDAELGIRLARNKLKTKVLYSRTYEEAPNRLSVWIKQRTRWIKGYIQTYLAHTRDPMLFVKDLGGRAALWSSCVIGISSISHVLCALNILVFIFPYTRGMLPQLCLYVCWLLMCVGVSSLVYTAYIAKINLSLSSRWWWCYPFYFVLHSIAAVRSIYQLFAAPHLWEKTPHGISTPSVKVEG